MTAERTALVRERRRPAGPERVSADICVVGAGIAGISAAIEAARAGRTVALIDAAPTLGGQSVAAMIGTFCGLYSNGPAPRRIVHGIADEILAALDVEGAAHYRPGRRNTTVVQYQVDALSRWITRAVDRAGITVLTGALVTGCQRSGRRLTAADAATRTGALRVHAEGFVDASGDANLAWLAGLEVHRPATSVYGSMMITLTGVDHGALAALPPQAIRERLAEASARYGLVRHDGFAFAFPGREETLVNMTHFPTPLTPTGQAEMEAAGQRQADRLLTALRGEFPQVFGAARVGRYGRAGIRQTRSVAADHTLTVGEVRGAVRFPDAVAHCSWPIEFHDDERAAHWEVFGDDHVHQVPLRSLLAAEADNLAAVGRCIDADPLALASVRVMGTCIATGRAAATALDLTLGGAVRDVSRDALHARLHDNLDG